MTVGDVNAIISTLVADVAVVGGGVIAIAVMAAGAYWVRRVLGY